MIPLHCKTPAAAIAALRRTALTDFRLPHLLPLISQVLSKRCRSLPIAPSGIDLDLSSRVFIQAALYLVGFANDELVSGTGLR
jgi:hypothetical protein